jgi:hypothetical protein
LIEINKEVMRLIKETGFSAEDVREATHRVQRYWDLVGDHLRARKPKEDEVNQVTGFFAEQPKPKIATDSIAPDGDHSVPVVTWMNGEKQIVGEAIVMIKNGIMTDVFMNFTDDVAQKLGLYMSLVSNSLSLGQVQTEVVIQNRQSISKEN